MMRAGRSNVSAFHQRLKQASEGVSQVELARRTGTAQSAISRIFRGGDPSFSTLIELARALDVTVSWLVGEADSCASNSSSPAAVDIAKSEQQLQDCGHLDSEHSGALGDGSTAVGRRLREERDRLGLTQKGLAAIGGQAVNSQSNYERGIRTPNCDYLSAVAQAGADVLYIVTGRRKQAEVQKVGRLQVRLRVDEAKLAALGADFIAQLEAKLNRDDFITIEPCSAEAEPVARPHRPARSDQWSLLSLLGLNRNRREG